MSKPMQIILSAVVVILIAAGSFYGGVLFGKQQTGTAAAAAASGRPGQFQPGQGALPGFRGQANADGTFSAPPGVAFGQIEEIDGDSLIIATNNGARIRVQVTDTTLIEKSASVTVSDLEIGETVMVNGSENDDGTGAITARSIQAGASGRIGGRFGGAQTGQ